MSFFHYPQKPYFQKRLLFYRLILSFYILGLATATMGQNPVFSNQRGVQWVPDTDTQAETSPAQQPHALSSPLLPTDTQIFEKLGDGLAGPQFFYDAKTVGLDSRQDISFFKGEVVVIGAGIYIAADQVSVDRQNQILEAQGHVMLLSDNEIFMGDKLELFITSGNLKITNATLAINDEKRIHRIRDQVLGFSAEEVFYETQRQQRLDYLKQRKVDLQRQNASQISFGDEPSADIITSYALALEQENLARSLPNPALARLNDEKRRSYQKRRQYWGQMRKNSTPVTESPYFQIQGALLQRTDGNDYRAEKATVTPCLCEDDETPAWGFYAEQIDAQMEGYVNMQDAVLEIKGIPVLFFPRLKLPLKNRRQSGFLIPTLRTGDRRTGTVFTQPVYFNFADNMDSTITNDFFQERGTRMRLEGRYEHRRHSGIHAEIQTIRDKVWINERQRRSQFADFHEQQILGPASERDPDYTLCQDEIAQGEEAARQCLDGIQAALRVPNNTWRHSQEWQGNLFLSPRIKTTTQGELRSDHRYVEDLALTDDFAAAFAPAQFANSYNQIRNQVGYHGSDYYLGLTSLYGDNIGLSDQRFAGLHIPGRIDYMSRIYHIPTEGIIGAPIYSDFEVAFVPIQERPGRSDIPKPENYLSSGRWENYHATFIAPLKPEGIYTIDAFVDTTARRVSFTGSAPDKAHLHSWQTGIRFKLPLDALWKAEPDITETISDKPQDGERYYHHLMDWHLTLSTRPVVASRGDYWQARNNQGGHLTYFNSDWGDSLNSERRLNRHRSIGITNTHRWRSYRKIWKLVPAALKPGQKQEAKELSYREQAIKELKFSQDRLVSHADTMFTPKPSGATAQKEKGEVGTIGPEHKVNWHVNRYKLLKVDEIEPVSLSISSSYDFIAADRRREQLAQNARTANEDDKIPEEELARPLFGPKVDLGLNWAGYSLLTMVTYNTYRESADLIEFILGIPTFYETTLGIRYKLEKQVHRNGGDFVEKRTGTGTLELKSLFLPRLQTDIKLIQKSVEDEPKPGYENHVGLTYLDPSGCWGLRFLRSQGLFQEAKDARYVLELTVLFLGQARNQDVSPLIVGELK